MSDETEWVLVPRDATPEMWEAGMNCHSPDDTQGDYLEKAWSAMLAAAPQPPAEAQPCGCGEATCTVPWEPGCGLGKSEQHAKAQAQGDGELPSPLNGDFDCPKAATARSCPCGFCRALRTPSAPVGVEGVRREIQNALRELDAVMTAEDNTSDAVGCAELALQRALEALAQQPAAGVGEEIMVNAAHDVYTLPLQPSGLSSGPRFVVHVPGPEQPAAVDGDDFDCPHSAFDNCDCYADQQGGES